jgi:hypothetical protein
LISQSHLRGGRQLTAATVTGTSADATGGSPDFVLSRTVHKRVAESGLYTRLPNMKALTHPLVNGRAPRSG